jgi:uncharacterized protein (TIGR03435 family)
MKADVVMRLAIWLVESTSQESCGEAFAGDLLEYFAHGRSRWWCLTQALFRSASHIEQRLRTFFVPLWYCIGFVFLHPLWQRIYAPSVTHLLTRYRGTTQWPGSAVLEIVAGLLPAMLFVWMGIFVYLLLRRQTLQGLNPVRMLLSLNVGGCLLMVAMMVRLNFMPHDLRLFSHPDFYYPFVHTRFSVLLFLGLFASVALLSRECRPRVGRRYGIRLLSHFGLHRIARTLGLITLLASPLPLAAQWDAPRLISADGKPMEFDVVSVKPNHSGEVPMNIGSPPMSDELTITNMPVENIVQWAFGIFQPDTISGLPPWTTQERYDVAAKVSDADVAAFRKVGDPVQRAPMLQKILVDRFGLKFHYETKELPVYALTIAKNGNRMTEIQPAIGPNGMKDGGGREVRRGQIRSLGQPMKPLVNQLTIELKRPVIDRTGLTGYYNFTLKWTPDETNPPAGAAPEDPSAPSIFTALQEQLGLKLEHTKAPVQVLVIDHLERPSEN